MATHPGLQIGPGACTRPGSLGFSTGGVLVMAQTPDRGFSKRGREPRAGIRRP